jgi:hypothetical protein
LLQTPIDNPFGLTGTAGTVTAVFSLAAVAFLTVVYVPIGVGVAVLRYRLWDLDRLISRTVTYAVVTALLVLPYLLILPAATRLAQGSGSLAVAALTLAAAAAFAPLRRRVQALVDRRFNRRRYDAARTIEAFSGRLRDQVDLTALEAELLAGWSGMPCRRPRRGCGYAPRPGSYGGREGHGCDGPGTRRPGS